MAGYLKGLTKWPAKQYVFNSKPKRFSSLPDLRAIIDCSEIFIETPKDLTLQKKTWSYYKHTMECEFCDRLFSQQ